MQKTTLAFDRDAPHLPKTIVAKLPTSYRSAYPGALAPAMNALEREIRFYTDVAPKSPIRTPKPIYGAMDSVKQRYVLLMEDCSYCTPADPELQGLTYEQTKIAVSRIADFHACWWGDDNAHSFPWMPNIKKNLNADINLLRTNWDIGAKIDALRKALPEEGWEAGLKICQRLEGLIEGIPENNLTIIHHDYKADNMLFDWNNPEDSIVVFDWGGVGIGPGMTDLSRLLGFCLEIELRRQVEKDMVKLYYEHLRNKGIFDYSLSECWTDYLRGLLLYTGRLIGRFFRPDRSHPRGLEVIKTGLHPLLSKLAKN